VCERVCVYMYNIVYVYIERSDIVNILGSNPRGFRVQSLTYHMFATSKRSKKNDC
jgi:hypothetical protein